MVAQSCGAGSPSSRASCAHAGIRSFSVCSSAGAVQHGDRDLAVPRIVGGDRDGEVPGGDPRVGVQADRQGVRRRSMATWSCSSRHPADDVRRAARAAEPRAPQRFAAVLRARSLLVIRPALQRVVVEERRTVRPKAQRRKRCRARSRRHPGTTLCPVARNIRQAHCMMRDRRAGLGVRALGGQLVPVADRLVGVPAARARRSGRAWSRPCRPTAAPARPAASVRRSPGGRRSRRPRGRPSGRRARSPTAARGTARGPGSTHPGRSSGRDSRGRVARRTARPGSGRRASPVSR